MAHASRCRWWTLFGDNWDIGGRVRLEGIRNESARRVHEMGRGGGSRPETPDEGGIGLRGKGTGPYMFGEIRTVDVRGTSFVSELGTAGSRKRYLDFPLSDLGFDDVLLFNYLRVTAESTMK